MPENEGVCDNDGAELLRRPDDEEAVVRNRLEVYKKQTQPIEDFYRKESILAQVSGERSPDEVFDSILEVVN
jgi:adenylate kinase